MTLKPDTEKHVFGLSSIEREPQEGLFGECTFWAHWGRTLRGGQT